MSEPIRKVVIVTGASSGIGEATAIEYAMLGHKVVITGRNEERLNKVCEQLVAVSPSKSADDFLALKADFEDPAEVEPVIGKTIETFHRIDVLVNNAGYLGQRRDIRHAEFFEDFHRLLQVNLFAPTRLIQLARPYLEETKGVIVNISSVADRMGMPVIGYSVSKAGLNMLTRCVTNALDGTGVRVITVSPGPIITNITGASLDSHHAKAMGVTTSLHRAGQSKEVADIIVFLSEKATFITGSTVDVDGGMLTKFGGAMSAMNRLTVD